jgi:hypothetical protein
VNVFAIRHGETAWSLSGQHTGTTDIPLNDNGRRLAKRLRPMLAREAFALVLCSPMQRARETCEIAGLAATAVIAPDLAEWNYGGYEGLTPKQIHETAPGWLIFRDGCPGGETPGQVGARVDRVIARARVAEGMSRYLRMVTCCGCSQPVGSGCPRAPDSTSCSIPAPFASSAITATSPLCGSGTGRLSVMLNTSREYRYCSLLTG